MSIDQHTVLYGVIGFPLKHTLSPVMHNAALRVSKQNAVYLAFETEDIEGCVGGMRAFGMRGLSVTLPHKSAVIPYLDDTDPLAAQIGAVNTIVNDKGRLVGYNTDALGALTAIEAQTQVSGKRCLIIGAGGAARAIGFVLKREGAEVLIANRTADRGEGLARLLECPFVPLSESKAAEPDILVQTTPVGMHPREDQCPVEPEILFPPLVVMDIVYNPLQTKLLTIAQEKGCRTINGLAMFIHQGAEQFRLWTGLEPPVDEMTRAVREALGG
jgi:shikimate dehydrogenase